MANMNHCPACRQHFLLHEHLCPHCGAAAPGGRMGRYVRQARMGGLMLFTALTTTACYGSPPMPGTLPRVPRTPIEQPLPKLPTTIGTAYVFVTPKGQAKQAITLKLAAATLEGTAFTLTEASAGGAAAGGETSGGEAAGPPFTVSIEAAEASAFVAPAKDEPFLALPVEKMRRLSLSGTYQDAKGRQATVAVALPGATAAQGNLQLSRLEDDVVAGVLRVDYADTLIEVYFLAAR